jgi:hypothetical protein
LVLLLLLSFICLLYSCSCVLYTQRFFCRFFGFYRRVYAVFTWRLDAAYCLLTVPLVLITRYERF